MINVGFLMDQFLIDMSKFLILGDKFDSELP